MQFMLMVSLSLLSPSLAQAREANFTGEARFTVTTNVFGVEVEGSSNELKINKAQLQEDKDSLTITKANAILPTKSLKTGMDTRDEHMNTKVFVEADKTSPPSELILELKELKCPSAGEGKYACQTDGKDDKAIFKIGPKSMPIKLDLRLTRSLSGAISGEAKFDVTLEGLKLPVPSMGPTKVEDPIQVIAKVQEIK